MEGKLAHFEDANPNKTESTASNQRDYFFDNAKFFLIIFVVLGHVLERVLFYGSDVFYQFIYLFHMPAFVFIVGYFTKSKSRPKIAKTLFACGSPSNIIDAGGNAVRKANQKNS